MNTNHRLLAARLLQGIDPDLRRQLTLAPIPTVMAQGVRVRAIGALQPSAECSCDGALFLPPSVPTPTICYLPTLDSRRENFTVLHEYAHLCVRWDDDMLSDLADMGDDGGRAVEELVCDALAGAVLLPDHLVDAVLGGRRPEAAHLNDLFARSSASKEACAVRLAQHLPDFGFVALLDPRRHELQFAAPSDENPYRWRRGSSLPLSHPAWRAAGSSKGVRGEGEVVWASRSRANVWMDAVPSGSVIAAVFSKQRYWEATGLGILGEAGTTRSLPTAFSGTCRHCGAAAWGYRACDRCGDVRCQACARCGCGAPHSPTRPCSRCNLIKGRAQFRAGSSVCRDCER